MASKVDSQSPPQCCKDNDQLHVLSANRTARAHHREPLTTSMSGPRKHDGFTSTKSSLENAEDKLVVDHRVSVVCPHGIGAIEELDTGVRDPLAEVSLHIQLVISIQSSRGYAKPTLNVSTPRSIKASSFAAYHFLAAGLVKSTMLNPGCHRSHLANRAE